MAEKKPEAGDGDASPKRPKLLLFIVIGVLAVMLAGGGGAYFLMKKKAQAAAEEDGDEPVAAEKGKKGKKDRPEMPPVFVKLEPFTVKLQAEQQEAYLQATPELRVIDAPISEKVKLYTPEIRHKILLIMSGKKASDLSTPQGVQKLSNEMRGEINLIIDGPKVKAKGKGKAKEEAPAPAEPSSDHADPEDSVQAVLFTSFIIQ